MDHVSIFRNAVKRALWNLGMQSGWLIVDVDEAVVFAGDDDNRHLKVRIFVPWSGTRPESSARIRLLKHESGMDEAPFPLGTARIWQAPTLVQKFLPTW